MACTFFGHRNTPDAVRTVLRSIIEKLISDGVSLFYVGNEGNFDRMVLHELQAAQKQYPHIEYFVVLAYPEHDHSPEITVYPEGMELASRKYAIDKRNRWMLKRTDTVVAYADHYGGAKKYRDIAMKQGKRIFDLA